MTLTEQWKKGELEAGWYYVLLFSNEEYITFIDGNWVVDDRLIGDDIKEVLTLVPGYDDWKRIIDDWRDVSYENKNLKKLLKESAAYVKSVVMVANDCKEYEVAKKHNKLFMDICEAIGEKK